MVRRLNNFLTKYRVRQRISMFFKWVVLGVWAPQSGGVGLIVFTTKGSFFQVSTQNGLDHAATCFRRKSFLG